MELLDIRVAPSITTVASFFTPGAAPYASLVEDSSGNLFGTTSTGGTSGGNGTVFEVPYSNSSHSYGSLAVLASFNGTNGAYPHAGLFEDSGGNLFGTTEYGGSSADGTVFELLYNSAKQSYGSLTTLANFNSTNGSNPIGGLTEDGSGNLFGTTEYGGSFGKGIVFEIPYNSSTHAYGSLSTLASFNGTNGANPYAGLGTV